MGCALTGLGTLALTGVGLAALTLLPGGSSDDASRSPTTAAAATPSTTEAPPETKVDDVADVVADVGHYTITYRVETFSGDTVLVDTEVRRHRFPFESEVLVFSGEPDEVAAPDDAAAASERTVHVMGGFVSGSPGESETVFTVPPGVAARLGHFGGDVARAVDEGLLEPTGRRLTVAGDDCDIYRTRSPLDVVRLQAPTDDEFADLCIAADGFVLREALHVGGALFRRRTAVSVAEGPIGDGHFALSGFRIPDSAGGGRVRQLTPDSTAPGAPHLLPATLPEGFASVGRFVYVADAVDTDPGSVQIDRIVSLVDVFVADGELLVVENGGNVSGDVTTGSGGVSVVVPGHPEARGHLFTHQSEIHLPVGRRFVRLTSTLPLDQLTRIAGELRDHQGTGEVTPISDELDITGRISPEDLETHQHEGGAGGEHTHDGSSHTHG